MLGVSGPRRGAGNADDGNGKLDAAVYGWKAEDIVTHAEEIFFSEEEIKKSARQFK